MIHTENQEQKALGYCILKKKVVTDHECTMHYYEPFNYVLRDTFEDRPVCIKNNIKETADEIYFVIHNEQAVTP